MSEFLTFQRFSTQAGMYELTCKWLEYTGMEYKLDIENGEYLILLQQKNIDIIRKMIIANPRIDHQMKDDLGIPGINDSALEKIKNQMDGMTSDHPKVKPAVNPEEYQTLSDYFSAIFVFPGIYIGLRILMTVKPMPDEDTKINRSKQERNHAFTVIAIGLFAAVCWYVVFTKLL